LSPISCSGDNMTPKYLRLSAAERRHQILDAANELFAERGYEEVFVEDIASSAGVTRGLVHHYFGGRKEVYIALLERLRGVRGAQHPPPRARGAPPRQGGGARPAAPRRRATPRPPHRHRRGLTTAALRARVLDRAQPRRNS